VIQFALLNAGIPMLGIWPLSWLALAPVIWIEWLVVRRRPSLAGAPIGKGIAWANVASSIIGVPIAWFAWLFMGRALADDFVPDRLVTRSDQILDAIFNAAWLSPYADGRLRWMVPVAMCVLLVPCFLVSVLMEHCVCRAFWRTVPRREVLRSVVKMNLTSYAFLVLVVVGLAFLPNLRW
jgi:hypothetical protein